jgi:dihydroorotase
MPNTQPVNDDQSVTEYILSQAARDGSCRVHPIGAVTRGLRGEELTEFGDLLESGAVAFSDDGRPVASGVMMRRALEYSRLFDVPIIDHCEDLVLGDGGVMNEGHLSTLLGLKGHSRVAEEVVVMRDLLLAELTGARVHLAHVSTARAVAMIREAKARGVRCSAEATPHHLVLTDEAVREYDTRTKMKPPLRTEADREALLAGLQDGTIDALATDHAPHHPDKKKVEFSLAPFGIVGLETALPLLLDRLVRPGHLPLARLVDAFAQAPRRILNLPPATLKVGASADLTVLDLDRDVTVEAGRFRSLSRNTPFGGWSLKGAPVLTLVGGETRFSALV